MVHWAWLIGAFYLGVGCGIFIIALFSAGDKEKDLYTGKKTKLLFLLKP